MCAVQGQDSRRQVGNCPKTGAVYTLFLTPGHEEVLVTGQGGQLWCQGHNALLHDVLQNEKVMMVSALPGKMRGGVGAQMPADGGRRERSTMLQVKRAV